MHTNLVNEIEGEVKKWSWSEWSLIIMFAFIVCGIALLIFKNIYH